MIRRIVFGEPQPGFAQFAKLLAPLSESVSYVNRDANGHDRVTDVPFTWPVLGMDYTHPNALVPVCAPPPANDEWGLFSFHHIQLYHQGVIAAKVDPVHVEAARLCMAIYDYPGEPVEQWDASGQTAGVYWAIKKETSRTFIVFRGSDDLTDWMRDATGFNPAGRVNHDQFGPMWGGFLIGMADAWDAIKSADNLSGEVVITGHSLGAAHADIACAYALTDTNLNGGKTLSVNVGA